jgi:hypothetical protein
VSARAHGAEATPLLDPTTLASATTPTRAAPQAAQPVAAPAPARVPTRTRHAGGPGRRQTLLAVIAGGGVAVFAALGPDPEPAPVPVSSRPAAGGGPVAAAAGRERSPGSGPDAPAARGPGPTARPPSPHRRGRRTGPGGPEPTGGAAAGAARTASVAAGAAVEAYLAGDLEAARRAVAGVDEGDGVMALAVRLEAIARLLGPAGAWPPPGGAAALERLLELERALALARPSPLALRAGAELADRHTAKAERLAEEGRWEESLAAVGAALARKADHEPARRALARLERVAEATYLEGYVLEDADPDAARRLYTRAARLAPAGSDLAGRVAARLGALGSGRR